MHRSQKNPDGEEFAFEQVDLKFYKRLHCADITSICPDNGFAPHELTI